MLWTFLSGVLLHNAWVVAYVNAVILIGFVIITQQYVKHVEDPDVTLAKDLMFMNLSLENLVQIALYYLS